MHRSSMSVRLATCGLRFDDFYVSLVSLSYPFSGFGKDVLNEQFMTAYVISVAFLILERHAFLWFILRPASPKPARLAPPTRPC